MKAYLSPLKICPGVFSYERSIAFEDYQGEVIFGFFSLENVKDGRLEVEIGKEENGLVTIRLPKRIFQIPGDKEYLTVRKDVLTKNPVKRK